MQYFTSYFAAIFVEHARYGIQHSIGFNCDSHANFAEVGHQCTPPNLNRKLNKQGNPVAHLETQRADPSGKHLRNFVNGCAIPVSFAVTPDAFASDACERNARMDTPADDNISGVEAREEKESGTLAARRDGRSGDRRRAFERIYVRAQSMARHASHSLDREDALSGQTAIRNPTGDGPLRLQTQEARQSRLAASDIARLKQSDNNRRRLVASPRIRRWPEKVGFWRCAHSND